MGSVGNLSAAGRKKAKQSLVVSRGMERSGRPGPGFKRMYMYVYIYVCVCVCVLKDGDEDEDEEEEGRHCFCNAAYQ